MLGPGPVVAHIDHAWGLAGLLGAFDETFVDLGSGAGVPGLALLIAWPEARALLVESQQQRARFLEEAVGRLGLGPRALVLGSRAEDAARDPAHRGRYGLVVARAFGGPAVTAECGVGLLRPGGVLAVSEPPEAGERWDVAGLARLGLGAPEMRRGAGAGMALLRLGGSAEDRWPRRAGMPAKRPLWR